ncbi:MAG: hypothetical protein AAB896_01860 [Patescibacteria group bacterium]
MRSSRKHFTKADDGTITAPKTRKPLPEHYKNAIEKYLTIWDELFEKAQEADEFQFIFALLRFKGMQSSGWDTFENTIDAFEGAMKASRRVDGTRKLNLLLWLYGHIVEASDHYEIIANMVNIAGGEEYHAWNFPKIRTRRGMREQTPNEKILAIQANCQRLGLKDYTEPFTEVLDKELRNAIYHSDYSAYEGKVRFRSSSGFDVEYDVDKTNRIVNQSMALHETIKNLVRSYTASYTEPKLIDPSASFSQGRPMKAQLIVRKRHGVIAMKEVPDHSAAFMVGIFQLGEKEKIEKGIYLLPRSKSDALNKVLDRTPQPLARRIVKLYRYLHRNHYRV